MSERMPTSDLSDAELVRRVAQGEAKALELLYDRSAWFVYANALRMLQDASLAQNLVPDVFLSFWRWQASYPGIWWRWEIGHQAERSSLTTALLSITSRLATHQSLYFHNSLERQLASDSKVAGSARQEEVRKATLRVATAEAMDWLPTPQRQVIELRTIQGLTVPKVAEQLGRSPEATNDLLSIAIGNLQRSMGFGAEEITEILAPTDEESDRIQSAKEMLIAEIEAFLRKSRSQTPAHRDAEEPQPAKVAEMVEYLRDTLGPKLTALAVDITDARELTYWASSEIRPSAEQEKRVRNTFDIAQMLLKVESPQAVRSWFLGMNPELDDRAPALVIAEDPESVAEAAQIFVANG